MGFLKKSFRYGVNQTRKMGMRLVKKRSNIKEKVKRMAIDDGEEES